MTKTSVTSWNSAQTNASLEALKERENSLQNKNTNTMWHSHPLTNFTLESFENALTLHKTDIIFRYKNIPTLLQVSTIKKAIISSENDIPQWANDNIETQISAVSAQFLSKEKCCVRPTTQWSGQAVTCVFYSSKVCTQCLVVLLQSMMNHESWGRHGTPLHAIIITRVTPLQSCQHLHISITKVLQQSGR